MYWAICSRHSHYHTSAGNVIQIRGSLYSGGNSKFVMHVHLKVLFWWNLQFRLSRRRTLENEISVPWIKDHFIFLSLYFKFFKITFFARYIIFNVPVHANGIFTTVNNWFSVSTFLSKVTNHLWDHFIIWSCNHLI